MKHEHLTSSIGLNAVHWAVINKDYGLLEKALSGKSAEAIGKTSEMLCAVRKKRDSRVFIAGDFFFPPDEIKDFPLKRNFDKGSCPVHFAAATGDVQAINLFINYKSNVNVKDGVGATPLHLACQYGHTEAAKLLLNPKTKINEGTKTKKSLVFYDAGTTPLHAALASGNIELVRLLIDNGADITLKTKFGCDSYFFAARGGNPEVIRLLSEAGLAIPATGVYGNFPLLQAVQRNNYETVEALLKIGSPLAEPQGHQAPLAEATKKNYLDIRNLLVAHGAQPFDYKDNISSAASNNDTTYIREYHNAGKDINAVHNGTTALMMAAAHGRTETVKLLLSLGADVNINTQGTALHFALDNNYYDIASLLLEHNIDCSLVDEHGNTALFRMATADVPERIAMCRRMIALGANPHAKSRHGGSAYAWAKEENDEELLAVFDNVSAANATDLSYVAPTASRVLQNLPDQYKWTTVYDELWNELVPPSGNASSLQGELLRAIGKLSDEFFRNGNINWDDNKSSYMEMIALLKTHLLDGSIAVNEKELREALTRLTHFNVVHYEKDESPHRKIAEAVVQWCVAHKTLEPVSYA